MTSMRFIALVTVGALGWTASAPADTLNFTCDHGWWYDPDCWDAGRIPTASDDVRIDYPRVCNVGGGDAVCRSFVLGPSNYAGTLTLSDAGTLTFSEPSYILGEIGPGRIIFQENDTALKTSSPTAEIRGPGGEIVGQHATARIIVDNPPSGLGKLVCKVPVRGILKIEGTGEFVNEGGVTAEGGTLIVGPLGTLGDKQGDMWLVREPNSTLLFVGTGAEAILSGNFVMDMTADSTSLIKIDRSLSTNGRLKMTAGVLDVNEDVFMGNETAGNFAEITGGKIDVEPGKKFEHR